MLKKPFRLLSNAVNAPKSSLHIKQPINTLSLPKGEQP